VVKFFCEPPLQSDKSAIPEANSVAHDVKNYSALNTDEDAVLYPYTGSPICSCCEDQYFPDALASIRCASSAPLAVKRYGGCRARQKPGMAGTDAVGPVLHWPA